MGRGLASVPVPEARASETIGSNTGGISKNTGIALASSEASASMAEKGNLSLGSSSSSASDSPWVSYMAGTSKTELIERLRQNSSLRDALRQRMDELRAKGDGSGMVELLQEALAEAGREDELPLKNLKPVSVQEAFAMDSEGTAAEIRGLLSELSGSEEKLSLETSLFDRNSFALRRSLVRGAVKGPQ
jgi:hypothetical protein